MKFTILPLWLCMAVFICTAQNVSISGKVTNVSGVALSGAVVRLERGHQTTTTDADGSFILTGDATSVQKKSINAVIIQPVPTISNGWLNIEVKEHSEIEIGGYNIKGQTVSKVKHFIEAGSRAIALPQRSSGVYLYKVKMGSNEYVLKGTFTGRNIGISSVQSKYSTRFISRKQSKINAAIADVIADVIAVTKEGYLNYRMIMKNSDTSGLDIQMIVCEGTVTDIDGNVYQTVKIGNQVWTVENLMKVIYQ